MNRRIAISCAGGVLLALGAGPAAAKTSADDAARLGNTLTPIGAEKAANADGTIPEWTGGMTRLGPMFDGYKPGAYYPDPFPEDKPRFKITPANVKQYEDRLPAGSVTLLQRNPDYFLNVYPTRRTATYPDAVYAATLANATTANLVGDDGLKDAKLGFPFPIPKSGAEPLWNHKLKFRGSAVKRD